MGAIWCDNYTDRSAGPYCTFQHQYPDIVFSLSDIGVTFSHNWHKQNKFSSLLDCTSGIDWCFSAKFKHILEDKSIPQGQQEWFYWTHEAQKDNKGSLNVMENSSQAGLPSTWLSHYSVTTTHFHFLLVYGDIFEASWWVVHVCIFKWPLKIQYYFQDYPEWSRTGAQWVKGIQMCHISE